MGPNLERLAERIALTPWSIPEHANYLKGYYARVAAEEDEGERKVAAMKRAYERAEADFLERTAEFARLDEERQRGNALKEVQRVFVVKPEEAAPEAAPVDVPAEPVVIEAAPAEPITMQESVEVKIKPKKKKDETPDAPEAAVSPAE